MNKELQVSNLSSLQSFNQDGVRVAFQSGQFPQNQIPIKLNKNAFIGIGITQMIIGVTCFGLNIRLLSIGSGFSVVGYGIWGGIFFFISGLLAFLTGSKRTSKCLIVSTMVMNVFSACASVPVLILSVMDAVEYFDNGYNWMDLKELCEHAMNSQASTYEPPNHLNKNIEQRIIAALAIIETIISTICSALCCNAYCCWYTADNVVVIYGYPGNLSNSNVSGYQGLVIPPQPVPQKPPVRQPPPVPQQPLSSKNIPSIYEDVDTY